MTNPIIAVTKTFTLNYTGSQVVEIATTNGAYTVTLPNATLCTGAEIALTKTTSDSNIASIQAAVGQTINGSSLLQSLVLRGDSLRLESDGSTDWRIISSSKSTDSVPLIGSSLTLFGHSLAAGGGVVGNQLTKQWADILAESLRARLWNQSVGGAVLGKSNLGRAVGGWGGVMQVLQGLVPNPYSAGTNWRGAYSSTAVYAPNDGVYYSGGWYRNESQAAITNTTPGTGGWQQITGTRGTGSFGAEAGEPAYPGLSTIPIFWYGTNDLGDVFQGNDQEFLTHMESILSMACASAIYDASNTLITYAGGTFTPISYTATNCDGFLTTCQQIPNTAGATITFITPADWPGGYVDFHFVINSSTTGSLAFTVDGTNTNVLNSGTGTSNTVNFGSPARYLQSGASLATALTSGVAVTSLALNGSGAQEGLSNGTAIVVGPPGSTDTFTTTGFSSGATSIPVNSQAPTNNHPVNDPVSGGTYTGNVTVRVPTTAGSHTIVATVPASPNISNLFVDGVVLESPNPPPIIVGGLPYMTSYSFYWPSRNGNDALTDTWNTDLKNLVAQFPSAYYVDTTQIGRPGAKLATALTASQTGVTSLVLQSPGLPYAVASGDSISIGSGTTQQYVTASGAAAQGALSVPVTSFTSTYAQPVGTWVWDSTVIEPNYYQDGIHYSHLGHQLVAQAFLGTLKAATAGYTPQQAMRLAAPSRRNIVGFRYNGAGNLAVGTGIASQWGRVGSASTWQVAIPADPGDMLEIVLSALWDAPATVIAGWVDLVTINPWPASFTLINYVSGFSWVGQCGTSYLGLDAVGGQLSNGLSMLLSGGSSTNQFDHMIGVFHYPVQYADIQGGYVYVGMIGKSSSTTTRNIEGGSANMPYLTLKNLGPASYAGESV